MSENRITPSAEGQEKDVLLVLDKQQGKVSAVKEFDKGGNLQTVPPIQGGEFVQVDRNGDIISNLVANFYRKFQDTDGLAERSLRSEDGRDRRDMRAAVLYLVGDAEGRRYHELFFIYSSCKKSS